MSKTTQQVKMTHTKETKGTHQYGAAAGAVNPAVTTLYVNKSALPATPPAELTLTIEF
jgi:hypothetical protein